MRLELKLSSEKHLDELLSIRNEVDTQLSAMVEAKGQTIEDVKRWTKRYSLSKSDKLYVVELKGICIGYVQLNSITLNPSYAKLGIVIAKKYQGKGFGKKVMELIINKAFKELKINKIILEVLSSNFTARKLYTGLGFREVGKLIEHFNFSGKKIDVIIMEKFINK
ncbi:MAG: hypothetical protein CMM87_03140 [Rickettsiales bacterium]|nr:hypothetical protein [Rickettsiales bacterium]|tara:strand:+ start:21256 stop:21753 length:498 start_codon:yes stop_codon:yes gene_type:complete